MIYKRAAAGTASASVAENARSGERSKAKPSLLEQEAIRFAEPLDDYDHVSVTDIGCNFKRLPRSVDLSQVVTRDRRSRLRRVRAPRA